MPIATEILTGYAQMMELQPEWDALLRTNRHPSYMQSSVFASCLWKEFHEPRGETLRCVTVREDGGLVLIWALTAFRKAGVHILRPLYLLPFEATEPLMLEGPREVEFLSLAWAAMRSELRPDAVMLPRVKTGSPLHRVTAGERIVFTEENTAFRLEWEVSGRDWDSYCQAIDLASTMREVRRRKRRLEERGRLTFKVVESEAEATPLIDWCYVQKQLWGARAGKPIQWAGSEPYRNLLISLFRHQSATQRFVFFVLALDDEPIAAALGAYNHGLFDGVIAAFDMELRRYSPGSQLHEYVIRWAFDRGLDLEFGIGVEDYKRFWCHERSYTTATRYIAATLRGRAALEVLAWRERRRRRGWSVPVSAPAVGDGADSGDAANKTVPEGSSAL